MSRSHDVDATASQNRSRLPEMDWHEVQEPGCYLHVSSGMLMRFFPEDSLSRGRMTPGAETAMVKLAEDPQTPLVTLRAIAAGHGYFAEF